MKRFTCTFCSALLLLTACSGPRSVVVLLPDADGKTGQITVANTAGSQLLQKPFHSTEIVSPDLAPKPPQIMDEQSVASTFGETIAALPPPPLHFVLYFKNDTTELTDESRAKLAKILPAITERTSNDVSIVGHTDRVGEQSYNYRLGLERALHLRKIILALGVNPDHIETTSHGENNPLVATRDEVSEPCNRRVEVVVR